MTAAYLVWTVHVDNYVELYEAAVDEFAGYVISPHHCATGRAYIVSFHDATDPEGNAIARPVLTVAAARAIAQRHHQQRWR